MKRFVCIMMAVFMFAGMLVYAENIQQNTNADTDVVTDFSADETVLQGENDEDAENAENSGGIISPETEENVDLESEQKQEDGQANKDTGDEKNEEVIDYEIKVTSSFASKEQLKKMSIGDKMKFSFTVLPEYKGVITHEVANEGETVKCELEHLINGNTEDIYILTMSGSRGEAKFWYNEYRSWGGSQMGNVQPMYFSFGSRIIDGDQVYCKYSDEKMRWPNMYIVSEFGGGKLTSVKFAFNMPLVHLVNGKIHLTDQREQAIENAAECFDIDYIVYSDEENSLADNFADRDKE